MPGSLRRHVGLLVAILAIIVLAASQVVAQTAQQVPVPESAVNTAVVGNADRVDGIHAVGSAATVLQRAKKLVATNSRGYLPNNIIRLARNADRLDGLDSTAFARTSDLSGYARTSQLSNYVRVSELALEVTVRKNEAPAKGIQVVSVQCGAQETRTGGGFYNTMGDPRVSYSVPIEPNGWEARFAVGSDEGPVGVYAVCLKLNVD